MAQGFAAHGTLVGADGLRSHPISPCLALWINTLNRRARHDGHSELPQRPSTRSAEASPFGGQKFTEWAERTKRFSRHALGVSMGKHPNSWWRCYKSVENS